MGQNYGTALMANTDLLSACRAAAKEAATSKFAGDMTDLLRYAFSSPPPDVTPAHGHLAEAVRYTAFGDPVNVYNEFRSGGTKKVLQNSFWHPAYGKTNLIGYALPAALTGLTYANMDEGTRMQHKGELLGSAAGGLLGGTLGARFGLLGQSTLGVGGERLGRWAGQKLDNRLISPKPIQPHYGVNNAGPVGTVPNLMSQYSR